MRVVTLAGKCLPDNCLVYGPLSHELTYTQFKAKFSSTDKILSLLPIGYLFESLRRDPQGHSRFSSVKWVVAFVLILFDMYRVNKENRAAGVLDNFAEGEKYAEHSLRKFVRNKDPEIMPSINSFFADPK